MRFNSPPFVSYVIGLKVIIWELGKSITKYLLYWFVWVCTHLICYGLFSRFGSLIDTTAPYAIRPLFIEVKLSHQMTIIPFSTRKNKKSNLYCYLKKKDEVESKLAWEYEHHDYSLRLRSGHNVCSNTYNKWPSPERDVWPSKLTPHHCYYYTPFSRQ